MYFLNYLTEFDGFQKGCPLHDVLLKLCKEHFRVGSCYHPNQNVTEQLNDFILKSLLSRDLIFGMKHRPRSHYNDC